MKSNILKASLLITLIILIFSCIIVSASAEENVTTMLTMSKGGIILNYPSDWGYSQATSNDSVMAISKLDSIDSSGTGQININIEKRSLDGTDLGTYVNKTYTSMQYDTGFKLISSGEVVVGDKNGYEYIYISHDESGDRQHKAVWVEDDGQACAIMYSAPVDQFNENSHIFDFILSEIKFT